MANQNLIIEFWEFLRVRKRFWLLPIILVLLLFSGFNSFYRKQRYSTIYLCAVLTKISISNIGYH